MVASQDDLVRNDKAAPRDVPAPKGPDEDGVKGSDHALPGDELLPQLQSASGSAAMSKFDVAAINAICSLPPDELSDPGAAWIVDTVTTRLLQLLGDADAVYRACVNDDPHSMREQLVSLNLSALLVLLGSDKLEAVSENSVLMMADQWVAGPNGAAVCSSHQLRCISESLCLGQLSDSFLFDVVPMLKWMSITAEEQSSLHRFAAAGSSTQQSRVGQERPIDALSLVGPERWYSTTARPCAPSAWTASMTWVIPKHELEAWLTGAKSDWQYPRPLLLNGFTLQLGLYYRPEWDQPCYAGHSVCVQPAGVLPIALNSALTSGELRATNQLTVFTEYTLSSTYHSVTALLVDVPAPQKLKISSWEPFLVDWQSED